MKGSDYIVLEAGLEKLAEISGKAIRELQERVKELEDKEKQRTLVYGLNNDLNK